MAVQTEFRVLYGKAIEAVELALSYATVGCGSFFTIRMACSKMYSSQLGERL